MTEGKNTPESNVEKLFKSIGIGFGCKVIHVDKTGTRIATTGVLKSYDMTSKKFVITQQGKDEELHMDLVTELSEFKEADIVPPTRNARLERLARLDTYISYHTNSSRQARTPKELATEFAYINDTDIKYFRNHDTYTIINQLEANEGVSPYKKEKFNASTIQQFSRLADGVK